jgi:hypothetical protein
MDPDEAIDVTIEYDPERRVYRAYYERENDTHRRDSPSFAIAESIATIERTDVTTVDPLSDTVDMNALNALIQSATNGSDIQITFSVQGYRITVHSDGVIELRPTDSDTANRARRRL